MYSIGMQPKQGRMKSALVVFLLSVAHSASAASKYMYLFPNKTAWAYDRGP